MQDHHGLPVVTWTKQCYLLGVIAVYGVPNSDLVVHMCRVAELENLSDKGCQRISADIQNVFWCQARWKNVQLLFINVSKEVRWAESISN